MENITIKLVNATTGEEIERLMNPEELAEWQLSKENTEAIETEIANKEAVRLAVLEKLGLTADEAAALLN